MLDPATYATIEGALESVQALMNTPMGNTNTEVTWGGFIAFFIFLYAVGMVIERK